MKKFLNLVNQKRAEMKSDDHQVRAKAYFDVSMSIMLSCFSVVTCLFIIQILSGMIMSSEVPHIIERAVVTVKAMP